MINQGGKQLTWLFLLKILTRVLDLVLNILVLRDLDPGIYGLTTNLDLLSNFTLFYSKIVLKQTYSRVKDSNETQTQSAVNLMYFGLLITICIAPISTYIISSNQDSDFFTTAILFAISAIVDAASEPFAVQWVVAMKLNVVAKAEGFAVLSKTLVLYLLLGKQTQSIFNNVQPLIGFGVAQLFYSITLLSYLYTISQSTKLKQINNKYIVQEMKQVGYQFSLMALMKFFLQELEKLVIVIYNDRITSGEFTLVSHIGSIIPRFIYANIEQVGYNLFPKLNLDEQKQLLNKYLKLINFIGLSIVCAGIPCSAAFLSIYGKQWVSDSCVFTMQLYCVYIWVMGVNGITESFVNSTIPVKNMWWYRYLLIAQTIIYSLSLIILVQLGSGGIVISNILSMSVRILISIGIIIKQGLSLRILDVMPKFAPLFLLGFGFQYFTQGFVQLLLTGAYFGVLGLCNLRILLSVIKNN